MLSNQPRPQYLNHAHNSQNVFPTSDSSTGAMRGLGSQNSGLTERKPSRLEQMRVDYQKKLMKEKEEKMIQMYEDTQRKALMTMARTGSGNAQPNSGAISPSGGKSVREFFNERRRLEANGLPVPPIDNHYRQAKGYSSPGGWSSRTGSGNSMKMQQQQPKNSAGRDRANLLAPIRRPLDTQEVANGNNNIRSGIPQRLQPQQQQMTNRQEGENPFMGRPRLVKHKPLPPTSNNTRVDDNNNDGYGQARPEPPKFSPQHRRPPHPPAQQQQTQQQQNNGAAAAANRSRFGGPAAGKSTAGGQKNDSGQEKMSDFQKWQMEQNRAREERLKKLNTQKNGHAGGNDGVWARPGETPSQGTPEYEEEEEEDQDNHDDSRTRENDVDGEDEIRAKERELMERINQQQRELDKMRKAREKEEEEERREVERLKKKEAMERARQKKIEEEMRKEEERRQKEEENEERQEHHREEKRRKEEEKRRKEEEKRVKEEDRRRAQEEKQRLKRQREEEKRLVKQQGKMSSRRDEYDNDTQSHFDENSPLPSTRRTATMPSSSREPQHSRSHHSEAGYDYEEKGVAMSDASLYMQAAQSSDARGNVGSLQKCKVCGRSFAADRLKKHQDACKNAHKPRKTFDASKKRVEGTDLQKYAGKAKHAEPPKKKSNWRTQHEQFIQSLRYAKKATQYEKEGKSLRDLPPPPAAENPDFVPCPHCGRTFNETAAERHIPRCQSLKTRPPPMNTRRR